MQDKQDGWNFCEFDFDIKNIKGKENKVVDALSRRVHAMHASAINMCKQDFKTRILEDITTYEHYLQVKQELQQENRLQKHECQSLEYD